MARASASAVFPWKYQVFLSFRGEDTRRGFTDHLYKQLEARGIRTFRDEPELERGTDINPELLKAIDQSRSAIIVLSTNFASSSWCLRELTHIVRCMKEKKRIFPIFYGVDPSDVRHQRGSFGEAFAEHEVNYREHMEEVNEWRKSLKRVANLAGWNSKDCRYDTELIQGIELPWSWDIVIPGSEIPEWLNNQSMGDSVIEKQPSHSSNSKAVGFAFCVLFVGSQNISAPNRGVKWSRHYRHEITCLINFGSNTTFQDTPECPLRCITEEVASDHLWLSFLSMNCIGRHSKGKCWDQIRFRCKSETGLKVKKCGVCRLYEQKKSSTER
ncbi:hypothetical protein DVH24_020162 [Malus domestica]|uniref:ADP-ribosyl cyclase/cyclic ADP-ribose hydrolase n=1 Tax=Malus domestica TaxID=3750 RepID=A0A498J5V0_MALDO|nr:hypothetical protein DVH24_020162 [Malus domestica]